MNIYYYISYQNNAQYTTIWTCLSLTFPCDYSLLTNYVLTALYYTCICNRLRKLWTMHICTRAWSTYLKVLLCALSQSHLYLFRVSRPFFHGLPACLPRPICFAWHSLSVYLFVSIIRLSACTNLPITYSGLPVCHYHTCIILYYTIGLAKPANEWLILDCINVNSVWIECIIA